MSYVPGETVPATSTTKVTVTTPPGWISHVPQVGVVAPAVGSVSVPVALSFSTLLQELIDGLLILGASLPRLRHH